MLLLYNFYIDQALPACEEHDPSGVISPNSGITFRCIEENKYLCPVSWFKDACKETCELCTLGKVT